MAGLLTPLLRRRRRADTDEYHDYLARSVPMDASGPGPRLYRWVNGREGPFGDPVSRLIGILLRDALGQNVSRLTIVPGGFHTRVLFGEGESERLRLRRFFAPLLLLRLRGFSGMHGSGDGYYPQQGSFTVIHGTTRYGVLVTITMTAWGEQATSDIAVARP